jgi:hypothetical protein
MLMPPFNRFHSGSGGPKRYARSWLLALTMFFPGSAAATTANESQRHRVDLQLVLAVDVSSSMSSAEQEVQREGYVNAFRHPDVVWAIKLGQHGAIAVSYVEWAGPHYRRVVLPWTMIGSHDDANRFAKLLATQPIKREPGTSISGALLFAEQLLSLSPFVGERHVIDVSADGPNNAGPSIASVRERLAAAGVTINGLPVTLTRARPDNFEAFDPSYLSSYFEQCVIGGPGAFAIRVDDLNLFETALRRKLVREIANLPSRPLLASNRSSSPAAFDCSNAGQPLGR